MYNAVITKLRLEVDRRDHDQANKTKNAHRNQNFRPTTNAPLELINNMIRGNYLIYIYIYMYIYIYTCLYIF